LNISNFSLATYPQFVTANKVLEGEVTSDYLIAAACEEAKPSFIAASSEIAQLAETDLELDKSLFDLGRVVKGEKRSLKVQVSNPTFGDIAFSKIKVSCGCVEVLEQPLLVPASGSVEIPINFHSKKFLGEVTHSLFLWQEGVNLPMKVDISADVWIPVQGFPLKLTAMAKPGDKIATGVTTFLVPSGENVKLTVEKEFEKNVKAEIVTVKEGSRYELHVSVDPAPEHSFSSYLTVNSSHPEAPEFDIPFVCIVR